MSFSGRFWAHSDPDLSPEALGSRWQPLRDHLVAVSSLSRTLAGQAAPNDSHFQDLCAYAGLLHDIGKYSECFQNKIRGEATKKCPHAIHGAALASQPPFRSQQVAYAIAGHHAGMPDRGDLGSKILEHLSGSRDYLEAARKDCPEILALIDGPTIKLENISARADLFTRMLFSCLVHADRLDTAGRPVIHAPLQADERLAELLERNSDCFVDYSHWKRVAPDFTNAGEGHHEGEQQSNREVGSMHFNKPSQDKLWI